MKDRLTAALHHVRFFEQHPIVPLLMIVTDAYSLSPDEVVEVLRRWKEEG